MSHYLTDYDAMTPADRLAKLASEIEDNDGKMSKPIADSRAPLLAADIRAVLAELRARR